MRLDFPPRPMLRRCCALKMGLTLLGLLPSFCRKRRNHRLRDAIYYTRAHRQGQYCHVGRRYIPEESPAADTSLAMTYCDSFASVEFLIHSESLNNTTPMSRMLCQLKELQPSDDTGMTVPPPGTRRAKTMATPSSAHWATATRQSIRLSQQQWLFEPPVRRVSNHRLAKCTEPTLARGKPRWSRNSRLGLHFLR